MRVDYNGNSWNLIVGGVIGLVAGGGIPILSNEDLSGIIVASVAGGISGVVAASGLGLNFLKQSDLYLNASRAISSVTGSILSFLNLAEEE